MTDEETTSSAGKEQSWRITSASEGTCFEDANELCRKTAIGDVMVGGSSETESVCQYCGEELKKLEGNMVKSALAIWFARFLLGILIYFVFINILIFIQSGSSTITPINWLLNPLFNIYPHTTDLAIYFLISSILIGLGAGYFLIRKKRR